MLGNNNPCFGISRILAGKDGKLDNFGVRGCGFIENGLEDMHGGSLRLRPMVSIDLKLSKYALEPKEIVDGKVTEFELRENNS